MKTEDRKPARDLSTHHNFLIREHDREQYTLAGCICYWWCFVVFFLCIGLTLRAVIWESMLGGSGQDVVTTWYRSKMFSAFAKSIGKGFDAIMEKDSHK